MWTDNLVAIVSIGLALLELAALAAAAHAVMNVRKSQGAIAWTISLITLPFITLPLYAIFGRRKFQGYVDAHRAGDVEIQQITRSLAERYLPEHRVRFGSDLALST